MGNDVFLVQAGHDRAPIRRKAVFFIIQEMDLPCKALSCRNQLFLLLLPTACTHPIEIFYLTPHRSCAILMSELLHCPDRGRGDVRKSYFTGGMHHEKTSLVGAGSLPLPGDAQHGGLGRRSLHAGYLYGREQRPRSRPDRHGHGR